MRQIMWRLISFALMIVLLPSLVQAQDYPNRPIRLIVPFPAGAYTDSVARLVAQKMSDYLGQPVVVENRGGAGGNIGAAAVASSEPDGYTLLMSTVANAISVSSYSKLNYNLTKDLAPVSLVAKLPYVLVVHPSLPARTVDELVKLSLAKPGSIHYSSSGHGTGPHLATELFNVKTGANLVHVPYKGIAPAIRDTIGGIAPVSLPSLDAALSNIQAGGLRALAVTSAKRTPLLPNVPTMSEAGVPDAEISAWAGIQVPSNTPKEIIEKLNGAIQKALASPDVVKRFEQMGAEPSGDTPAQFKQLIQAEVERWAPIVKRAGLKIE